MNDDEKYEGMYKKVELAEFIRHSNETSWEKVHVTLATLGL
jgi:hypothetical protein